MRTINIYTKELHVVLVLFYRFVHGKAIRHAYCNLYSASVQRLQQLLENHEYTVSGDSGVLIWTFQFTS